MISQFSQATCDSFSFISRNQPPLDVPSALVNLRYSKSKQFRTPPYRAKWVHPIIGLYNNQPIGQPDCHQDRPV